MILDIKNYLLTKNKIHNKVINNLNIQNYKINIYVIYNILLRNNLFGIKRKVYKFILLKKLNLI